MSRDASEHDQGHISLDDMLSREVHVSPQQIPKFGLEHTLQERTLVCSLQRDMKHECRVDGG